MSWWKGSYLEANTVAISDFGMMSVRRSTYCFGDSSSNRGFGISIDCLDVEGRGELIVLASGEPASWVWGRAGIGGEEEKRFIDKRWKRGGFVEARGRDFVGSRGNKSTRSVIGWGVIEEKLTEGERFVDLEVEGKAPAVDGRPGRRAIPGDLEGVCWDGPRAEDGRSPGDMRSEWLRCRRVERLRSKVLRFGVDDCPSIRPGAPFPSLMVAEGRGGCGWTGPFLSAGGFGTGGSGFSGSEWTTVFRESFLRRQKEDFLEIPLAGLSGSRSLLFPSIAKWNGPKLSPLDRLYCRGSWGLSVGGSCRSFWKLFALRMIDRATPVSASFWPPEAFRSAAMSRVEDEVP